MGTEFLKRKKRNGKFLELILAQSVIHLKNRPVSNWDELTY